MLLTLFKAKLWKEFGLPESKCCWREMLSIWRCSPPLETWFPVSYCEHWFLENTREDPTRGARFIFARTWLSIFPRSAKLFLIPSIVYVNQKFFLKWMLISVIFLSCLTCFVTRSCNKTRPTTRRPEGNRSGSLETKWEESVSNYHIIQSILCVQLTTDGVIRFFGYFSNYSYELKH